MGIKEYGQAASEVELQDNPGPIKNQEGEAVIEITNDQDVGIGTSTPRRKLDILDASDPQLRLSHTDNTEYVELQSLSTGDAVVKMSDSICHLRSGDATAYLQVQNTTTAQSDGVSDGLSVGMNGYDAYLWNRETNAGATLNIGCGGTSAITINNTNQTTAVNNLSANGNVTLGDASGDNHTVNGTMSFAQPPQMDQINDASGDTVLTIDASANITFSNNVSISTGSTINMPATVTLPNTANGSVTTSAVAVDANGKDLTVEAGSTTGGSGTNNTGTGGDLTFKPGAGKGTAVGGDVIIQTAPAGASGTTVNNYTTQMIVKESGNVGMGTTGPDRKLDILDASNPQLRLTHTDATHYADMLVAGTGALTVANSGGAIRLDSAGDVELDSASTNATMKLLAAGTEKASIDSTSDDVSLTVATADKDFKIKGTDDSAAITAFTIDFSEAGSATFNNNIQVNGTSVTVGAGSASDTKVSFDGNAEDFHIGLDDSADNLVFGKGATLGATGTQYAALFRNTSAGNTFGGLTYVPHNVVDTGTSGTSPTVLQSSSTIILTNASGYVTLPDCAADTDIGTQFVIMNGATGDNSGAVRVQGSNKFYDTDNTSGVTANQSIDKMQAKSVICFGVNKWMIIG